MSTILCHWLKNKLRTKHENTCVVCLEGALKAGVAVSWNHHVTFPPHSHVAAADDAQNIFTFFRPQTSRCVSCSRSLWPDVGLSLSLWFHLQPDKTHERKRRVDSKSANSFHTFISAVYRRCGAASGAIWWTKSSSSDSAESAPVPLFIDTIKVPHYTSEYKMSDARWQDQKNHRKQPTDWSSSALTSQR